MGESAAPNQTCGLDRLVVTALLLALNAAALGERNQSLRLGIYGLK